MNVLQKKTTTIDIMFLKNALAPSSDKLISTFLCEALTNSQILDIKSTIAIGEKALGKWTDHFIYVANPEDIGLKSQPST